MRVRRAPVEAVQFRCDPLDDAWDREWRVEHRWHTRHPWGAPQVPPRPAGWRPGEPTDEAWLRDLLGERSGAMTLEEMRHEVYGLP